MMENRPRSSESVEKGLRSNDVRAFKLMRNREMQDQSGTAESVTAKQLGFVGLYQMVAKKIAVNSRIEVSVLFKFFYIDPEPVRNNLTTEPSCHLM